MKIVMHYIFLFLLSLGLYALPVQAEELDPADTLVKVASKAPDFSVVCTDNTPFVLSQQKGHLVLLNFFTDWCSACMREMPHLENEVWKKYKDKGLVVLCIGREHSLKEVSQLKEARKWTLPMAADPKRQIYGKYAKKIIPRIFLIDKSGKVIYETADFDLLEFKKMLQIIDSNL